MDSQVLMDKDERLDTPEEIQEIEENTKEKSEKEKEEEENPEKMKDEKSLAEKAAEDIDERLQKRLNDIEHRNQKQQEVIAEKASGHEDEIIALEKRDRARADMEAKLAQSRMDIGSGNRQISTIQMNNNNLINIKTKAERQLQAYIERTEHLDGDIKGYEKEMYEYSNALDELGDEDGFFANRKRDRYERKMRAIQISIRDDSTEFASLPEKIEAITKRITELNKEIEENNKKLSELVEENNRRKTEYNVNNSAYEEEKKKNGENPKWYTEYTEAKKELKRTEQEHMRVSEAKKGMKDKIAGMQLYIVTDEDGNEHQALIGEDGKYYSESNQGLEDVSRLAEEKKVETQLRAAPIFKEINETTIKDAQTYDPKSGEYIEGTDLGSDASKDTIVREIFSAEGFAALQKAVGDLRQVGTILKIDDWLTNSGVMDHPIDKILKKLVEADFNSTLKIIQFCLHKLPELSMHPVFSTIGCAIFNALGDILDFADKGEEKEGFTNLGNKAGMAAYGYTGELIAMGFEKLIGFLDWKTLVTTASKQAFKFSVPKGLKKAAGDIGDAVGHVYDAVSFAGKAGEMAGEAEFQKAEHNERNARMMIGVKNNYLAETTKNIIELPLTFSKAVLDVATTPVPSIAGMALRGAISLGFKLVDKVFGALVGWGFGKKDKGEIFESPQVFGNVKYNEDLVSDNKFNEILKNVTGITEKDKVYGVIKTMDAVSLHAKMMKSMKEPDQSVERMLSVLGYKDRTKYNNIRVNDVMKKTGYSPSGGDWRQELSRSLLVEGQDYKTIGGEFGRGWHTFKRIMSLGLWTGKDKEMKIRSATK